MVDNKEYTSRVRLKDFDPSFGYSRGVSKITEISWYLIKVIFFLSAIPYPNKLKVLLLKLYGAKIGVGINIKPRVNFHMPWKLEIGDYAWIGEEAFILNFEKVKIGSNACISQRAFLCGGNHNYRDPAFNFRNGPITIGDGAWVGACCFIGPGVTIGIDTVIAAGSYVTASVGDNGVYRGNPAVFISERWRS